MTPAWQPWAALWSAYGPHAPYLAGSVAATALCVLAELLALRRQRREALAAVARGNANANANAIAIPLAADTGRAP